MSSNSNHSHQTAQFVEDLQRETLSQLTKLENILLDVRATNKDVELVVSERLEKWMNMVSEEKRKVESLQLTLAFVGTMNAGKSMTLNSIIGARVLPSRATPMTTLPVVITHKPGQMQPILHLPDPTPFNEAIQAIKQEIEFRQDKQSGPYILGEELDVTLLKIRTGELNEIEQTYEGEYSIWNLMFALNDIIRICEAHWELENPLDKYTEISQYPHIEVEFLYLKNHTADYGGQLSLIDSPGPNEPEQHVKLKNIVETVLKNASGVICVLDSTMFKAAHEREIRDQIAGIQELATSRLFVLANKFDQSESDGLSEKGIIHYVSHHLFPDKQLENGEILSVKGKVYPISAKYAFYANMVKRAMSEDGELPLQEDWVQDFASIAYGKRGARNKLENPRDPEHIDASDDLWNESKLSEPLEQVIENSLKQAVPLSLQTALERTHDISQRLSDSLKFIRNARSKKQKELEDMIGRSKERLKQIQLIQSDLEAKKNTLLEKASDTAKRLVRDWWNEAIQEAKSLRIRPNSRGYITERGVNKFIFNRLDEIDSLSNIGGLEKNLLAELQKATGEVHNELKMVVEGKLKNVIENERQDLSKTLNLNFEIPKLELPEIIIDIEDLKYLAVEDDTITKYRTEERSHWIFWKKEVRVRDYVDGYRIDPDQLRKSIIEVMKERGRILEENIKGYVTKTFNKQVNHSFSEVYANFKQIETNLTAAIKLNNEKSQEVKRRITEKIESIENDLILLGERSGDAKKGLNEYFDLA